MSPGLSLKSSAFGHSARLYSRACFRLPTIKLPFLAVPQLLQHSSTSPQLPATSCTRLRHVHVAQSVRFEHSNNKPRDRTISIVRPSAHCSESHRLGQCSGILCRHPQPISIKIELPIPFCHACISQRLVPVIPVIQLNQTNKVEISAASCRFTPLRRITLVTRVQHFWPKKK